jgi:hypothetical protein
VSQSGRSAEVASGAKSEKSILDEIIEQLRSGDILVIWKLADSA